MNMLRSHYILKPLLALVLAVAVFVHVGAEQLSDLCCVIEKSSTSDQPSDTSIPSTDMHGACGHGHVFTGFTASKSVEPFVTEKSAEYLTDCHLLVEGVVQSIDQPPELI